MKVGDKYQIQPKGLTVLNLAGLHRIEEFRGFSYPVFSILTREPSEELRRLHDRMPLVLPAKKIEDWSKPDGEPAEAMSATRASLVDDFSAIRVGKSLLWMAVFPGYTLSFIVRYWISVY